MLPLRYVSYPWEEEQWWGGVGTATLDGTWRMPGRRLFWRLCFELTLCVRARVLLCAQDARAASALATHAAWAERQALREGMLAWGELNRQRGQRRREPPPPPLLPQLSPVKARKSCGGGGGGGSRGGEAGSDGGGVVASPIVHLTSKVFEHTSTCFLRPF
jgi:hypothetical protein